jgi:hypothetical protein
MEKNGMITEETRSDFDKEKKIAYYDKEGYEMADTENKHMLKDPQPVSELLV